MKIIERNLTTKISLEVLNLLARNEQNYASPNHLKIILRIHTYHKKYMHLHEWICTSATVPSLFLYTPFWPFFTPFWHGPLASSWWFFFWREASSADYFVYMSVCPSFKPILSAYRSLILFNAVHNHFVCSEQSVARVHPFAGAGTVHRRDCGLRGQTDQVPQGNWKILGAGANLIAVVFSRCQTVHGPSRKNPSIWQWNNFVKGSAAARRKLHFHTPIGVLVMFLPQVHIWHVTKSD